MRQKGYYEQMADRLSGYDYSGYVPPLTAQQTAPLPPPNQVPKQNVLAQMAGLYDDTVSYLNEPYQPNMQAIAQYEQFMPGSMVERNNEMNYAGTPRYQQWFDRVLAGPRTLATGSSSGLPMSIRNGWR